MHAADHQHMGSPRPGRRCAAVPKPLRSPHRHGSQHAAGAGAWHGAGSLSFCCKRWVRARKLPLSPSTVSCGFSGSALQRRCRLRTTPSDLPASSGADGVDPPAPAATAVCRRAAPRTESYAEPAGLPFTFHPQGRVHYVPGEIAAVRALPPRGQPATVRPA